MLKKYFHVLKEKKWPGGSVLLCNSCLQQVSECNRFPCPHYWEEVGWSACSTTCGIGVKTLKVRSFVGEPQSDCNVRQYLSTRVADPDTGVVSTLYRGQSATSTSAGRTPQPAGTSLHSVLRRYSIQCCTYLPRHSPPTTNYIFRPWWSSVHWPATLSDAVRVAVNYSLLICCENYIIKSINRLNCWSPGNWN